jgi:predicted TIM-barrel enzyme
LTSGGLIGAEETLSLDEACAATERMREAAVAAREDVLVVGHGGPFEDPDSVRTLFERVAVDGYLGASSVERLPVERAVAEVVRALKALRFG